MVSRAVDVERSPTPLAALVPSYRPIFDRLLAAVRATGDFRIRAMWLSGSLAKATGIEQATSSRIRVCSDTLPVGRSADERRTLLPAIDPVSS